MSNYVIYKGELYHYGVPGMKWGVRKNASNAGNIKTLSKKIRTDMTDEDRDKKNAEMDNKVRNSDAMKKFTKDHMNEYEANLREQNELRKKMIDDNTFFDDNAPKTKESKRYNELVNKEWDSLTKIAKDIVGKNGDKNVIHDTAVSVRRVLEAEIKNKKK